MWEAVWGGRGVDCNTYSTLKYSTNKIHDTKIIYHAGQTKLWFSQPVIPSGAMTVDKIQLFTEFSKVK